jgi:hypothetical protein
LGPGFEESKIAGPACVVPLSEELIVTPANSLPTSSVPLTGPRSRWWLQSQPVCGDEDERHGSQGDNQQCASVVIPLMGCCS